MFYGYLAVYFGLGVFVLMSSSSCSSSKIDRLLYPLSIALLLFPASLGLILLLWGLKKSLCEFPSMTVILWAAVIMSALSVVMAVCSLVAKVEKTPVSYWLLSIIILLIAWQSYTSIVPSFGWDALSHWYHHAVEIHEHCMASPEVRFAQSHRHPNTLRFYNWLISGLTHNVGWLEFSVFSRIPYYAGFTLFVVVMGREKSVESALLTCLIMYLTLPLLENHALIGGYAEANVSATLFSAVLLLTLHIRTGNLHYLFVSMLLGWSLLYLKNTGPFYFLCLFITGMYFWYLNNPGIMRIIWPSIIALAGTLVAVSNYARPKLEATEEIINFTFFGRTTELMFSNPVQIIFNEVYSKALNQSFSLGCLMVFMAYCLGNSRRLFRLEQLSASLVIVTGFFGLALSQLSVLGYSFALPYSDTGNSRFFLAFSSCVIVVAYWSIRAASEERYTELKDMNSTIELTGSVR